MRPLMFAAVLLVACSNRSERAPGIGSAESPIPRTVDERTDASVASIQDATLKQHMRAHFAAVSDLQRAIARGQLAQAKQDAQWIVDHDEPEQLAEWKPFVDDMKQAARTIAAAADLPTAGALASRLGRACSRCHEQTAAVVAFSWQEAPADAPALAAQMKRHQWAAARLWEGLVGPSDDMWREGATILASTQLDTTAASGGTPRGDVPALAGRLRELATKAGTLDDQDARAATYGELLSTCAGCHTLVRPTPVPGP